MDISDATVLVVEDEQLMRRFTVGRLKRLGVQKIIEAVDGSDGLKKMAHDPHVVLTDIHMKPMGGIEFVRALRASRLRAHPRHCDER